MLQSQDHNTGPKLMTKGELQHLLCRTKTHFGLTFQIYISKASGGFIWPGYRNSLWSTKSNSTPKAKTSDFLHMNIPTTTFWPAESWPRGTNGKTKVQFAPVSSEKNDLTGRMTTEEGVTLFSILCTTPPSLPGTTNFVFKNLFLFFLHCERERNEFKRHVISKAPPKTQCWGPLLSPSSPTPETQLFHGCLLSPTKWLPFVPLAQDPRAGHTWLLMPIDEE